MTDTSKARPFKVGLTGGIGSGKTFVSSIFSNLGVPVFNTDEEVKRDVLYRDVIKEQMVARFGTDSYVDGRWNRDKFIQLLFYDTEAREFVNTAVSRELVPMIEQWSDRQVTPYVLIECAVMFENGLDYIMDRVIAVTCDLNIRIHRLHGRGVSEMIARKVMGVQLSDEERIVRSDWQLPNDSNVDRTVEHFHKLLTALSERNKL